MRVSALILAGLTLSACATGGSTSAPPPSLADIKATILANKGRLWKDPDSVRDASLSDAWRYLGMGWMLCMKSNARNSFGGYTGLTTSTVLIYDNGAPPLAQAPVVYDGCEGRSYSAFPEIEAGYKPPLSKR